MLSYTERQNLQLKPKNTLIRRLYYLIMFALFMTALYCVGLHDDNKITFFQSITGMLLSFGAMWLLQFIKDMAILSNIRRQKEKQIMQKRKACHMAIRQKHQNISALYSQLGA